jgi:hypothetical protein
MELRETITQMQNFGKAVVKGGKTILKTRKATTSKNTLYNSFNYLVTSDNKSVTCEFRFGDAEDYWEYVDQGVQGATGMPDFMKKAGRPRAKGSPFRFKDKMPPRRAIDRWIVGKPLKAARDEKGRFIERKSLAFLIQRSVFYRGIKRTMFLSRPFEQQLNKRTKRILEAFANDMETELKTINLL